MKKVFLLALLVVGFTTFAQGKRGERKEKLSTEERVELHIKKLTTDLSLNEKQAQEVKALMAKQAEKREAKRAEMKALKEERAQQARPSKEEMAAKKAEMQKEQEALKAEMKKILTAEQYTKWDQKREDRKEKVIEKMKDKKKRGQKAEDN